MQVVFKLYYKNEYIELPGVEVNYRVVARSNGAIVAQGKTNASGDTAHFDMFSERETFRLLVDDFNWVEPETDRSLDDADTLVDVERDAKQSLKVIRVRILPYFKVRFINAGNNLPLQGAEYKAFAIDSNGKEAVATDLLSKKPIKGETNSLGYTDTFHCARNLTFKFSVPRTNIRVTSKRFQPMLQGQRHPPLEVRFKTSMAITKLNETTTAQVSGTRSVPVIVSPQDQELIVVPQSAYDEFLEFSGQLDAIMAAQHHAKLNLSRALESKDISEIKAAEKALNVAGESVKKELNKNFKTLADLKEVMTFEVYGGDAGGQQKLGIRRRYLRNDAYMEARNKKLNKTEFKLSIKFAGTKTDASVEPEKLDVQALKESFKKIATKTSKEWEGDPKVINLIEVAGNEFADSLIKSKTYEVTAQAQWLRLVTCAGANAEFDWKKKTAKVQGNWQAKAVLCEGKMTGSIAVPSLLGWKMQFGEVNLGAIRFAMEISVYGFAGAKVIATGTMGVAFKNGNQTAYPIEGDRSDQTSNHLDPDTRLPQFDVNREYPAVPENLNGAKGDIDAFVGVEGGITPAGKIQWLPPQEPEFVSFAEASVTGAVSAGAGVKLNLAVYYSNGKFRVSAAARVCLGVGCKGGVEFTVDTEKISEFVKWMQYQLLHAGFRKLVYIDRRAFAQCAQLVVLLIEKGIPFDSEPGVAKWKADKIQEVESIAANIDALFRAFIAEMESDKRRQELINKITNGSADAWLKHAAPEVIGMILYQIIYHGTYAQALDTPKLGGSFIDPQVDYLPSGKKAITHIMKHVTTTDAWLNVMQHISFDGSPNLRPAGKSEGDILRYLNDGLFMPEIERVFLIVNAGPASKQAPALDAKTGNAFVDDYIAIRKEVLGKFPPGYKVAQIGTPAFDLLAALDGQTNSNFMMIRTAGLGEAYEGDPGSSLA